MQTGGLARTKMTVVVEKMVSQSGKSDKPTNDGSINSALQVETKVGESSGLMRVEDKSYGGINVGGEMKTSAPSCASVRVGEL